jgi:hypothetical protein
VARPAVPGPQTVAGPPGVGVDAAAGRSARPDAGASLSPIRATAALIATPTAAATPSLDIRRRQPGGLFPADGPCCTGQAHRALGMLGGLLAADGSGARAEPGPPCSQDPMNP